MGLHFILSLSDELDLLGRLCGESEREVGDEAGGDGAVGEDSDEGLCR